MRGRPWDGLRSTAPIRSPGNWRGRLAATRARSAIWAGRIARWTTHAGRRPRPVCLEAAMTDGVLYIGNMRYSSWSMRGWLAVKLAGLNVDVRVLRFTRPGPTKPIAELSPNGLVPVLEHNGARVWES